MDTENLFRVALDANPTSFDHLVTAIGQVYLGKPLEAIRYCVFAMQSEDSITPAQIENYAQLILSIVDLGGDK
jgi:hypothetical protein